MIIAADRPTLQQQLEMRRLAGTPGPSRYLRMRGMAGLGCPDCSGTCGMSGLESAMPHRRVASRSKRWLSGLGFEDTINYGDLTPQQIAAIYSTRLPSYTGPVTGSPAADIATAIQNALNSGLSITEALNKGYATVSPSTPGLTPAQQQAAINAQNALHWYKKPVVPGSSITYGHVAGGFGGIFLIAMLKGKR